MSTFEALNYALRKTKDGVVVSFVVQPNDVTPELLNLPVGAHVVIEWKEYSEANEWDEVLPDRTEINQEAVAKMLPAPSKPADVYESFGIEPRSSRLSKPKTAFRDMSLPQQAGIRCGDTKFCEFLAYAHGVRAPKDIPWSAASASFVRMHCDVKTRSELSTNHEAANKWRKLNNDFEAYLLTQRYPDQVQR